MDNDINKLNLNHKSLETSSVYDLDCNSVNELLYKTLHKMNSVIDYMNLSLSEKTDLWGDHKGSWQGLNKPTLSEEGAHAQVEKNMIDIVNINSQLDNIVYYNDIESDLQLKFNNAFNINKQIIMSCGTYTIKTLTFPENVYSLKNVVFEVSENNGSEFNITINNNCKIDELNIVYKGNTNLERLLKIMSNVEIGTINLISINQVGNINDTVDSAIIIEGENININTINTNNFDYPINIYNCNNVNINNICINTYVRGVYIRSCKDVFIDYLETRTFSPNASFLPGHNGLLIEECEDLHFNIININDIGEHGIRIGGVRDRKFLQRNMFFNKITIRRCMRNGFKMLTATNDIIKNITINELTVIDANWNGASGDNKNGLHLDGVENITISTLNVKKELNPRSCSNALYVTNSKFVFIDNLLANNTAKEGILIDDISGVVNDLFIKNINIRLTDLELIKINHKKQVIRDYVFTNIYGREFGSDYGINILCGTISQPLVLDGYVNKGNKTGIYNTDAGTTALNKIYNKLIEI